MRKLFIIIPVAVLALALVLTLVLVSCNRQTAEVSELSVENTSSMEEIASSEETTAIEESSEAESIVEPSEVSSKAAVSSKEASSSKSPAPSSTAPSSVSPTPSSQAPPANYPKTASEFLAAVKSKVNTNGYTSSFTTSTLNGLPSVVAKFKNDRTGYMFVLHCPQSFLGTKKWTSCYVFLYDAEGREIEKWVTVASADSFGAALDKHR